MASSLLRRAAIMTIITSFYLILYFHVLVFSSCSLVPHFLVPHRELTDLT